MTRSLSLLLLATIFLAACSGAADTAATPDGDASETTDAATTATTAGATEVADEEAEAAVALAGFCEDMAAWVAARQEYEQVEAGSPEEAAAVEEMERLTPLISERVDIPELVDALELLTEEAAAFVSGEEPSADPDALDSGVELINNVLTNC